MSLLRRIVQTTDGAPARAGHEANDGEESCSDGPGGLPGLGMVARYGQTNLFANLKPSVGLRMNESSIHSISVQVNYREENDIWRLHWILGRHNDPTMIHPALEVCILWSPHREVPLEEVVIQGSSVVLAGGHGHLRRLSHQSLDS